MLTIFMFESQLMQMPGARDIVIYWPGPGAVSVMQKPQHTFCAKASGCPGGGGGGDGNQSN